MKYINLITLIFVSGLMFFIGRWVERQRIVSIGHSQALMIHAGSYADDPALENFLRAQFYFLTVKGLVKADDVRLVEPKAINVKLLNYKLPVKGGVGHEELLNLYEAHYRKVK